jgi:hypothetical protein
MDNYQKHIEELMLDPSRMNIYMHWNWGKGIFKSIGLSGGCLTQIRNDPWLYSAKDPVTGQKDDELTMQIHADESIPESPSGITPEHFEIFANWQRKIDLHFKTKHDGQAINQEGI